ncbi:MAG: hypothetical protein HC769_10885 [Cyanobacteria bacterium CRU_2_1]|nr:hypothetical protein [Cyanobacteria bacterium RU_5_0]NJR59302.1 hypothetical protein [Cyanobacteria bacterium CRU_2_1]
MKAHHKSLLIKTATWIFAEVLLNLVGLDNLADYSEFLFDQRAIEVACNPAVTTTLLYDRSDISALFA